VNRNLLIVFFSSFLAMANPSLLAAVTVMLLLPHPKRLMSAYLLGAYTTSIAVGLAFVFSLHGSNFVKTSKHTLSPGQDILAGLIAFAIAVALLHRRDEQFRRWRERRKAAKAIDRSPRKSWSERMLGGGSAGVAYVVGAAVSFPGVTYLNALDHIVKLNPPDAFILLLVVYFCAMQQIFLEVPLISYAVAPEWTHDAVVRFRAWLSRRGRVIAVILLSLISAVLVSRGLITLL
jgi:hypothetical protein